MYLTMTRAAVIDVVCATADDSGRARNASKDVANLNGSELNIKAFRIRG